MKLLDFLNYSIPFQFDNTISFWNTSIDGYCEHNIAIIYSSYWCAIDYDYLGS